MKVADALRLDILSRAKVVAGVESLDNAILWVNVVDVPDPLPWVQAGQFMLTTGYAWPRDDDNLRRLISDLAGKGLAGLGFAVPNFFENISLAMIEAAEENRFPLLEIPWDIPFSSITEQIHRAIISHQYELLEKSNAIHRELMRGTLEAESLQDIARSLGRLIHRNLTIDHPEGGILASYLKDETAKPSEVKTANGSMNLYKTYLPTLRYRTEPVRIPSGAANGAGKVIWPIHLKSDLVALLSIEENGAPLSEIDIRAAEHAMLVVALHISQQRQLASLEAQLGFSFLESLQEGSFHPTVQTLKRAEMIGFNAEGTYRLGLLVLDLPLPLSRTAIINRERYVERLRQRMRELGEPQLLSFAQNQISVLIPERLDAKRIWESFQTDSQVYFAVSRPHEGIAGVQKGYKEVCSMLPHLAPGHFYEYEQLLVPRLLLGDREAREMFIDKMFKPLRQTRNGDMLVDTLVAAAEHGFQLKKTADKLCIHPKTLRYRLDKAVSIGGFDLNDADTQFRLQLASRILSLGDK